MLRLSRKAWNNVLIFSTLFMILLFNSTHKMLTGDDNAAQSRGLLPDGGLILTLEFGPQKIERVGTGWRGNPPLKMNQADLSQMLHNWQQAQMQTTEIRPEGAPLVVVVWLAGETSGRVYQLFAYGEHTLARVDEQFYQIDDLVLNQLVLPGFL